MISIKEKQQIKRLSKKKLDQLFFAACCNGNLELVEYLSLSPELKVNADIHTQNDCGFKNACANGHLDIVKFLLVSPKLKIHVDIHVTYDIALCLAAIHEQLEVVKYLLESPELKDHGNVHALNDDVLKEAVEYEHKEMLQYLILDYQIAYTEDIKSFLKSKRQRKLIQLFEKREFYNSLQDKLIISQGVSRPKMKI